MNRRRLITGLLTLPAAPAIIRVSSLMPVRSFPYTLREIAEAMNYPGFLLAFSKPNMKIGELYRIDPRTFNWGPHRPIGPALARGNRWNDFRLTPAGMAMVP